MYASASSSSSSDASMPPSSPPSYSPSPTVSSPEGSFQGPSFTMYEHNEPSKGFLLVDLDLEEEEKDLDTSQDGGIARKLFDDLNRGLLRPPDDGNISIISDSEEEEVHEDDRADVNTAPSSLWVSPAPPASTDDDDHTHPMGYKMIVVAVGMRPGLFRVPRQKGQMQGACTEEFKNDDFALLHHRLFCKGE
jgi:hypothetical protein